MKAMGGKVLDRELTQFDPCGGTMRIRVHPSCERLERKTAMSDASGISSRRSCRRLRIDGGCDWKQKDDPPEPADHQP
jgi:hypothetical protein